MALIRTLITALLCAAANGYGSNLHTVLGPCMLADVDGEVLCGKLQVPENRELPNGRRISLNVVVIPSTAENPASEPLFFLDGGPGMPATDAAALFAAELPFRRTHDIVLVDQRGTGQSNPLHCDLIGEPAVPQNYLWEMYPSEAVAACRDELEQRADLTQYTTLQFIADLDAVREWLGYNQINLYGISYGTRAAYAYMRAYPDRVRSAILMGTMPVDGKMPFHHAVAAQASLDSLFADCRADSQCNTDYPELGKTFAGVLQRMEKTPERTTSTHPISGDTTTVILAAPIFAEKIRSLLYTAEMRAHVPYLIAAAFAGDFKLLLEDMIPTETESMQWFSEGLYLSLTSSEDFPLIDTSEARRRNETTFFGNYRVEQQVRAASLWLRGVVPPSFYEYKEIATPVLFISGGRDPVTPPHFAARVAQYCSNSRHLILPPMAHLVNGLDGAECVDEMMADFLVNPDPSQIDTACISSLRLPPFISED